MSLAAECRELRRLAEIKKEKGEDDAEAKRAHKAQEMKVLELMELEEQAACRPNGVGYTFTADRNRVKGQVDDRRVFFEHIFAEEPSLIEFLDDLADAGPEQREHWQVKLHEALLNLTFVKVAERQDILNRWARKHRDDKTAMPPGTSFRPDPFVSVVKS